VLVVCLSLAAIAGDQVNYALGRKAGRVVFSRPDGRFIKRRYFEEAHAFYVTRGASAIVLARFVPILRTFVPFVAGVAEMPYRRFVVFNVLGGVLWVTSLIALGYFIGATPLGEKLHRVILVVIAVSLLPLVGTAYKVWRGARRSAA
jgi:membrane-associated protein